MAGEEIPVRGADQLLGRVSEALQAMESPGDVFIASRLGEYTRFAGSRVHQPQAIEEVQLMARSIGDGASARMATTSLGQAVWAGREASRQARSLSKRRGRRLVPLPGPQPPAPFPSIWHHETLEFTADRRAGLAKKAILDSAAVDAVANGMFSRVLVELAVGNSEGTALYTAATEASFSVLIRRGAGSGYRGDVVRNIADADPEAMIEAAIQDAVLSADPQSLEPGAYDVVLGPLAVGDMVAFFGALGFTGEAVASGSGPVATQRGVQIADPRVVVRDDASLPAGLPIPFDLEGVFKRPVTLLDHGRVGDAVLDLGSAAALGAQSTGHAHVGREQAPAPTPANLSMDPGAESLTDLVSGIESGLYLSRFHYTRLVDVRTTAITGMTRDRSYRIRDGKVGAAVVHQRFNEQIFGALSRVDGVGDRLVSQGLPNVWNGSVSAPALRVRRFHLGTPE